MPHLTLREQRADEIAKKARAGLLSIKVPAEIDERVLPRKEFPFRG